MNPSTRKYTKEREGKHNLFVKDFDDGAILELESQQGEILAAENWDNPGSDEQVQMISTMQNPQCISDQRDDQRMYEDVPSDST